MAEPSPVSALLESLAGGRYEEALGLRHDADREEINRAHVRALFRFRSDPAAREALNRVKGLLAEETPVGKARRLLRLERREEALAHLARALHGDPPGLPERERAEAHHLAGWALFQLGRYPEALPHLERAALLRGQALDEIWLGHTLERLSRLEPALECYRRAVALRGHAAECLLLGNALLGRDRWEEALPLLERARVLGADAPDLATVRGRLVRRRRRARLGGSLGRALGFVKREPLDWLLAGLTLAYGVYFFLSLVR